MAMSPREQRAAEFLTNFGLIVSKQTETHTKTPDFRVTAPDGLSFYVEVKAIEGPGEDQPLLWQELYNAITRDIRNSVKQFDAVNLARGEPNVLMILAEDFRLHNGSFQDLLRGEIAIEGELIADLRRFRFGRVTASFPRIDLIILLDVNDVPTFAFTNNAASFLQQLASHFGFGEPPAEKP